jgi:plastocyanin
MQRKLGVGAALAAATAVLALPTVASAASSRTVFAGPPPTAAGLIPKSFAKQFSPDANSFFGQKVTIAAGDTISFIQDGFHTIDLPAKGGHALPLVIPGAIVTGANDAAGSPFWFNGKVPNADVNPTLFSASGGHAYNGSARLDSGLPLGSGPPKPFKVKFTKAGTYRFFCDVHPGMSGVVVVKSKGSAIPSNKQYQATVAKELGGDVKAALKLAKRKIAKNKVSVGVASPTGIELFAMFPKKLTVKKNTVVTFSMSPSSRETHTVTFGPTAYRNKLAAGFAGAVFPPIGVYPSSPTMPITLSPTSHGNGFGNVGIIDRNPSPFPTSGKVDFTTPGTYHYQCLIHSQMQGTVVVK